jgi:hypothetical protein
MDRGCDEQIRGAGYPANLPNDTLPISHALTTTTIATIATNTAVLTTIEVISIKAIPPSPSSCATTGFWA